MNMPKPNLNWLYIIIVTALVALMFMNQGTDVSKTASYTEFKKYVSMGYATKIVANKDELTLQMYVKPEYAKEVFKTNLNQLGRSPFITVEFGSIDALEKFWMNSNNKSISQVQSTMKRKMISSELCSGILYPLAF